MTDDIEIKKLIDGYYSWLHENASVKKAKEDWFEIETPMLDRHNDFLSIYIRKLESEIELTDGGYILNDLDISGFDVSTSKRRDLIRQIVAGFGVKVENGEIKTSATVSDFNIKKHMLIQAMLSINDLFYLSSPQSISIFIDEVFNWFNQNHIRMVENCQFVGKSGFTHHFDCVIPKSTEQSERIIDIINIPNKQNIQNTIFKWLDTKDIRHRDTTLCAVLNDVNIKKSSVVEPLSSYGIKTVSWSKINEFQDYFAA
ncbi:MAG: DUF1828 domain-containing protein [Proteobacteria bacterium]|nr:DUF1828 domain-containing protein [Pseudomonadota bacterium]